MVIFEMELAKSEMRVSNSPTYPGGDIMPTIFRMSIANTLAPNTYISN